MPHSFRYAGGVKRVIEELAASYFDDDFRKGKSCLDWLSKQPEFGYQLLRTDGRGGFINPTMKLKVQEYQSRGGRRAGRVLKVIFDDNIVSWDRVSKSFIAEASSLRWDGQDIHVTNPKTGGSSLYVKPQAKKDREGDVVWWTLTPQGGGNHVFRVLND